MKEGNEGRIEIPDFDKDTIEKLIKWIYSGHLELKKKDFDEHVELYRASHQYCIKSLTDYLASKIVSQHVKPENVVQIFELGHLYENQEMSTASKKLILKYEY